MPNLSVMSYGSSEREAASYIYGISRLQPPSISVSFLVYTDGVDCGTQVELGAATVYSHYRPDAAEVYSHSQECQITFIAKKEDWKLKLTFDYLDIPDYLYNGVCTDALYIYDSRTVGERAFVSIWCCKMWSVSVCMRVRKYYNSYLGLSFKSKIPSNLVNWYKKYYSCKIQVILYSY